MSTVWLPILNWAGIPPTHSHTLVIPIFHSLPQLETNGSAETHCSQDKATENVKCIKILPLFKIELKPIEGTFLLI